jgi:hypothetical protein
MSYGSLSFSRLALCTAVISGIALAQFEFSSSDGSGCKFSLDCGVFEFLQNCSHIILSVIVPNWPEDPQQRTSEFLCNLFNGTPMCNNTNNTAFSCRI